jgi:16S rRNA (cytosine967-C5)-methyltransferase
VSSSAAVRAKAAKVVADVAMRGRSLDTALTFDASWSKQERGLLRSLCYDSIRWYIRLDTLLGRLLSRPDQSLDPEIRALAIVGLCQLLYTDIPAHAAVAETVAATRLLDQPRASGFVNAILRRSQREQAQLLADIDRDLAVRTAHPRWLAEKLRKDWREQASEILDANNRRPPFWIRVNRLRATAANYRTTLQEKQIGVTDSLFDGTALLLDKAMDVGDLPGFDQGFVSVQDAAAQLAAHLVDPRAGERILDACAAPGGKTGHLLELAPELAALTAVDLSSERLERVQQNLQRLGLSARLIAADAAETAQWWDGQPFHRILLDVPCSATGVIRRHPDIKLLRRSDDIAALAKRQSQLLRGLWPLLLPGGRLVYASCSVLQAETSAVIAEFLAAEPTARDATNDTLNALRTFVPPALLEGTDAGVHGLRIAPGSARMNADAAGMDGFYYAVLEKSTNKALPSPQYSIAS